jgi:hypothetical protein
MNTGTALCRQVVIQKNHALWSNLRFSGASGCRQGIEIGTSMAPRVPSCVMVIDDGHGLNSGGMAKAQM